MTQSARSIAEAYWKAECERDTEKVLAFYHEDATFCPPGQKLVGHSQIRTFYDASGLDFPGLEVEITNDFFVGDQSALEWKAVLTSVAGEKFAMANLNLSTLTLIRQFYNRRVIDVRLKSGKARYRRNATNCKRHSQAGTCSYNFK